MSEELLPCPFCGSGKVRPWYHDLIMGGWNISCKDCNCKGPGVMKKAEAIAAWNRRSDSRLAAAQKVVEGVKDRIEKWGWRAEIASRDHIYVVSTTLETCAEELADLLAALSSQEGKATEKCWNCGGKKSYMSTVRGVEFSPCPQCNAPEEPAAPAKDAEPKTCRHCEEPANYDCPDGYICCHAPAGHKHTASGPAQSEKPKEGE